jgi:hypothetical protein
MREVVADYTIKQWCEKRGYCRATFYNLDAQGNAPESYYSGKARRITEEADAKWLAERQAESATVREESKKYTAKATAARWAAGAAA